MIISRSPLRISLGGGGTDFPSYYLEHGGFLVAAAINKYVYISVQNNFFEKKIQIRYSKIEEVETVAQIRHPIIRTALEMTGVGTVPITITSLADIPAGTGMGSSGSFTTALLKALSRYKNANIMPRELAESACHIELDLLKEPIGKQDQYIAALGGITCFEFKKGTGEVVVTPLDVPADFVHEMEEHLLLFSTGVSRSASEILKEQETRSRAKDQEMLENLHQVKELGLQSRAALEAQDLSELGRLMHVHWQRKKKRSGQMTSPRIDHLYDLARRHGAIGGKLIGAGGGGFLMFVAEDPKLLRYAMAAEDLHDLHYGFDFDGTRCLT
jgi:D-glycero-alpha-D-manno-heptose-7-phosphate kinase